MQRQPSYYYSAFGRQVETNGLSQLGRGQQAAPSDGLYFHSGTGRQNAKGLRSTSPMESGSAAAAVLYARYPQMKDLGVVERTGPPHEPLFTVVVSVKGRQFRGVAASKKAAKHEACRAALRELHPNGYGQPVEPGTGGTLIQLGGEVLSSVAEDGNEVMDPLNETRVTEGACAVAIPHSTPSPFVGSKSWNPARRLRCQLCDMRCPAEVSQKFQKSALMLLNELFGSDVEWAEFETCGPPNKRTFRIVLKVKVGGGEVRDFPGESGKKREAKQVASFTALKQLSLEGEDEDFGEEDETGGGARVPCGSALAADGGGKPEADDILSGRGGRPRRMAPRKARKTPLQQLNEMLPNTPFTLIDDVGPSTGRFTFAVTVRGQTFHGTGVSKKEASHRAAAQVLQSIYSINFEEGQDGGADPDDMLMTPERLAAALALEENGADGCGIDGQERSDSPADGEQPQQQQPPQLPPSGLPHRPSPLHQEIARQSLLKYTELTALIPLTAVGRNIFATIVMHRYRPSSADDDDDHHSEPRTANGNGNGNANGTDNGNGHADGDGHADGNGRPNGACAGGPAHPREDEHGATGALPGSFEVVAIGTGTKVIDGNCLCTEGNRVHDCHGEVVARRAFVRYLYRQLELGVDAMERSAVFANGNANGDIRNDHATNGLNGHLTNGLSGHLTNGLSGHLTNGLDGSNGGNANGGDGAAYGSAHSSCSIFQHVAGRGFVLRAGIDFYMYVSSSPCGDGRVFVAADNCSSRRQDNHPRRMSRGLLRYKVEIGEGTLPSGDDHIQTLDGILGGERLRTMSCSDKMLCWNVLGMQGTLLTHFIAPVFVRAIVVGNLYSHEHMKRALTTRGAGADLAGAYLRSVEQPPELTHVPIQAIVERRDTARAAIHSFDWTSGDDTLEILQGSSGLRVGENPARICKRSFFERFSKLCERLGGHAAVMPGTPVVVQADCSYRAAKKQARAHRSAKQALMTHLEKSNGFWMKKPVEVSDFYL